MGGVRFSDISNPLLARKVIPVVGGKLRRNGSSIRNAVVAAVMMTVLCAGCGPKIQEVRLAPAKAVERSTSEVASARTDVCLRGIEGNWSKIRRAAVADVFSDFMQRHCHATEDYEVTVALSDGGKGVFFDVTLLIRDLREDMIVRSPTVQLPRYQGMSAFRTFFVNLWKEFSPKQQKVRPAPVVAEKPTVELESACFTFGLSGGDNYDIDEIVIVGLAEHALETRVRFACSGVDNFVVEIEYDARIVNHRIFLTVFESEKMVHIGSSSYFAGLREFRYALRDLWDRIPAELKSRLSENLPILD